MLATTATIAKNYLNGLKKVKVMPRTMGGRINELLGTDDVDRSERYTQKDLYEWLTGATIAPNGRRYNLDIGSPSTVSRLINGDVQNVEKYLQILTAICEIFYTDLEYLVRGRTTEKEVPTEQFFTPEANTVARLVDAMDEDYRKEVQRFAEFLTSEDKRRRSLHNELGSVLRAYVDHLSPEAQSRMRLLISQIENRRRFTS